MDQEHDYKVKNEKLKLHIKYLLIIAVILATIGISLALGENSEALGQISMASTVSSIILSAIAIFMSISGEHKLTYTHNKLLDTSDRLAEITINIEEANSLLSATIDKKFFKIDDIFDRLEQIRHSVDNVEKGMLNQALLDIPKNSTVDISDDTIWNVYSDMISRSDENNEIIKIAKEVIPYAVTCWSKECPFTYGSFERYLKSVINNLTVFSGELAIGIICVFVSMGITKPETLNYFEKRLKLSEEKRNKIEEFL